MRISESNKNSLSTILIILILGVLVLLFFRNVLFFQGNYIIQGSDLIQTYYQKLLYKDSLLKLKIPLWNPYIYSGYPFLAHPYNGTFYPLNLLFLIMPVNVGYSWILALHVFLAGLFMLFLVKYLFNDWWAALVSAFAFMFSGFTVSRIWAGHFELFATSIWIPLIFLLFLKTLEKKSFLWTIFTGLVLAIQFFAGHNQTSFFTLLILLLYTVFFCFNDIILCIKAFFDKLKKQERITSFDKKNISNTLFLFGLTSFFFFVFSTIQLIPTLELTNLSTRASGVPFFMSAYGSFPPDNLIRFLIPDFFGDFLKTGYPGDPILGEIHWEFTYYIGIIPLFMAAYSIRKGLNEKTKRLLAIIALFVFTISVLTRIVFLQLWRIRNSAAEVSPFITSSIQFFERVYTGEVSMWKIFPFLIIFPIIILLIFQYVKRKLIGRLKSSYKNDKTILFFVLLSIVGVILAFGHYSGGLYHLLYKIIPGYDKFKWPARHLIIVNFSLCVLAGYGMSRIKLKNHIKFILIVLILSDLFWYGNRYLYLKNLDEFFPSKKITSIIQSEKELFRIITFPVLKPNCVYEPSLVEFQHNACIPLHIFNITGYDPMILARYHEFTNILQNLPVKDFGDVTVRVKDLSNKNFAKMLNVRYLFMGSGFDRYNLDVDSFKIVANTQNGHLLLLNKYFPRFMFAKNVLISPDDIDLANRLSREDFDPEKYVLLEAAQLPIFVDDTANSKITQKIDIKEYSTDYINLQLFADSKGYLVSSEVYYPGWRAFINGKETKIYRSNYAFRSIFIPQAGEYNIVFKFRPISLKIGMFISLSGLMIASITLLRRFYGKN